MTRVISMATLKIYFLLQPNPSNSCLPSTLSLSNQDRKKKKKKKTPSTQTLQMGFFAKHIILTSTPTPTKKNPKKSPTKQPSKNPSSTRRTTLTSAGIFLAVSSAFNTNIRRPAFPPPAEASEDIKWGTRSYIWEKYFSPGLTPEDSVARIRQTKEGMKGMREMLERMSWRYVLFYVRLRSSYLETDLRTVMVVVPEGRRNDYVKAANQLVDDMAELDRFIRTPKVYESYLYYEKTLKSLDELIEFLA